MSETVKATIIGTIIVGLFMLVSVKMATNAMWHVAHSTREYVEMQKADMKQFILSEKHKAKEVCLEAAQTVAPPAAKATKK
jgi:hypothetical protein